MQDNFTHKIPGVADRQPLKQLAAACFRFLASLHSLAKDLQLNHAKGPFDSQHQLVIKIIQVVDLLLIGDQSAKDLAHLQQPAPVLVRARQARNLPAAHDSNLSQSYPAEDALESFSTRRRHARAATKITVDDLHIPPAQVSNPVGYLILKALTLQVVAHLFLARLP